MRLLSLTSQQSRVILLLSNHLKDVCSLDDDQQQDEPKVDRVTREGVCKVPPSATHYIYITQGLPTPLDIITVKESLCNPIPKLKQISITSKKNSSKRPKVSRV